MMEIARAAVAKKSDAGEAELMLVRPLVCANLFVCAR
jgi:hypothetical protein